MRSLKPCLLAHRLLLPGLLVLASSSSSSSAASRRPAAAVVSSCFVLRPSRSSLPAPGKGAWAIRSRAVTTSDDDPLQQDSYWEDLFMKGTAAAAGGAGAGAASPAAQAGQQQLGGVGGGAVGVEVVSFDLDDTLWCGRSVIANANRALQSFLETQHPQLVGEGQPSVASLMGALAKQYPEEYLEDPDDPGSIVRFTDLRKLALTVLAQRYGGYEPEAARAVAEEGFRAWHAARHDVDALFYPGAVPLLQRLRARGVRLVALTNGNCDIAQIPALEGVFEFCVNAEKVGARKRTGRPYLAAIKQAGVGVEVGPRWVHVGDDFTEDIVAAKSDDLKLRTLWFNTAERKAKAAREAEAQAAARRSKKAQQQQEEAGSGGLGAVGGGGGAPSLSTLAAMATEAKDRFFKDQGAVRVTATETDDFLAYSIVKEFADAEVETIEEMGMALEAWLQEGEGDGVVQAGAQEEGTAAVVPPPSSSSGSMPSTGADIGVGTNGDDSKYCIACRAVLPKRARFCSACGEPQA